MASTFHSLQDLSQHFESFFSTIESRYQDLNLPQTEAQLNLVKERLENPDLWQKEERREEMLSLQSEMSALDKKLSAWTSLREQAKDLQEYIEIAQMENAESLLAELEQKLDALQNEFNRLDLDSLLCGDNDDKNAFINLHPGAGGTESQDWADMLYRAYLRWAEQRGFAIEVMDYQEGDEAGLKNVTMLLKGENVYGYLKAENGIHRLVRISPFDSNKKRHTSFCSVHVSPELSDDVAVEINEKDLRIDTYRSSGAGGQHINKTDSAVRITHHPSGIVVACQNERSQIKNKATAMKLLKAQLYKLEQQKKEEEMEAQSGERKDISWGNQIRSYVFHPYNMVKDLRSGYETGNVQGVMDGNFDPFIDAFLRMETQ